MVSKSSGDIPAPLSWTSIESSPLFLKRTSTWYIVSQFAGRLCGARLHTDGGSSSIDAVLDQLFADGLKVDNNLSRLDLVYRAALDGFYGCHVIPCWLDVGLHR